MLPKKKIKHKLPEADLNIVPLMDILTSTLFFLLVFANFANLTSLSVSGIPDGVSPEKEKKNTFKLRVTLEGGNRASVWLGPVDGVKIVGEGELKAYLKNSFSGGEGGGYTKKIDARNSTELVNGLQRTMIPIKKGFPHEMAVTLSFVDAVKYQELIDLVSAVQTLSPTTEAIPLTDFMGKHQRSRVLFPDILMTEWSAALSVGGG